MRLPVWLQNKEMFALMTNWLNVAKSTEWKSICAITSLTFAKQGRALKDEFVLTDSSYVAQITANVTCLSLCVLTD